MKLLHLYLISLSTFLPVFNGFATPINSTLQDCIHAGSTRTTFDVQNGLVPLNTTEFSCLPNRSSAGLLNPADRDYRNWNSTVYTASQNATQLTGYYTKGGVRCGDITSPSSASLTCPVALKALFVMECDPGFSATVAGQNRCVKASLFWVYYALYQEVNIPNEAPLKAIVYADATVPSPNTLLLAVPLSYGKLIPFLSGTSTCASLTPLTAPLTPNFIQLGTDAYGAPICGPDPNQALINSLQSQTCRLQAQAIWQNGGSMQAPCEPATVSKVFKLSTSSLTTSDCLNFTAPTQRRVAKNGAPYPNFFGVPGGTLSATSLTEIDFMAKYTIDPSLVSPTFDCQLNGPVTSFQEFTLNGTVTLNANVMPGSVSVDVVGGGGGGGGTTLTHGGQGGFAATRQSITFTSVGPLQSCSVTIGTGGGGGSAGGGNGGWGGTSTVSCPNGSTLSSGGGEGRSNSNNCDSENGYGNVYGAGASAPGSHCSVGVTATRYGTGGSGGDCQGSCASRSGGSGANGYAKISWSEATWGPAPGF